MLKPEGRSSPAGRRETPPSRLVRFLLWDYERGSLPYEIAVLLVLLAILVVPGALWGDPLYVVNGLLSGLRELVWP